jgi:ribokinase
MTAGPIVCVGAHMQALFMHVERIPREGETVRGWGYRESVDGGKVANVAVAAARLGAPVALVTAIGTDIRSAGWRSYFTDAGIDTSGVLEFDAPMDVGATLLPPSKIPALVSGTDLATKLTRETVSSVAHVIDGASVVVCAFESPQDGIAAAFAIGRAAGATTILNASPVAALQPEVLSTVDILVVNEHEAAALAAGRTPRGAADAIRDDFGIRAVVVTAGAEGAYITSTAGVEHAAALEVDEIVDTTGAGDAFLGALAFRLREGDDVVAAARFATRAASIACTRQDTMAAFARLEEVPA